MSSEDYRLVEAHKTHVDPKTPIFIDNSIKTTKYTVLTFLPINLFEQFSRIANFYFLVMALLLSVPGVPIPAGVAIVPLVLVVSISAIREAIEQIGRARSDAAINNSIAHKLVGTQFQDVPWSDIYPGDFIIIRQNEQIPADCVVLSTNDNDGVAYVETANLDGETNLKVKQAIPQTFNIKDASSAANCYYKVQCDLPNNQLYVFNGTIMFNDEQYSLEEKQCLLRGSTLRNTQWAIGLVVYSGQETKLMQNANESRKKTTKLERGLNIKLVSVFIFMLVSTFICTIFGYIYEKNHIATGEAYYFYRDEKTRGGVKAFFMIWLCHFVVINAMIPISLYVTLEVVRVFQAMFVKNDALMYDVVDEVPANARTSTISDDLGQIEYVFSDKTGTLTRNVMEFMKCSIAGKVYGTGTTEIAYAAAKRRGISIPPPDPHGKAFKDDQFFEYLRGETPQEIKDFLWLLSCCHSVIPEKDESLEHGVHFEASSPDEAALVGAAADFGYCFYDRGLSSITVKVNGAEKEIEVLDVIEFTSARKRSSVIIRHPDTGKIVLFCKGADDLIYQRLAPGSPYQAETREHLKQFAGDGLRTLCCAYREIDENEYNDWSARYAEASCLIQGREEEMDRVSAEIESNLCLIGATAIEDKLQIGVPDTIASLLRAGINVWVITGDKRETAINIGFACSLLSGDMKLIAFEGTDVAKLRQTINEGMAETDKVAMIASGEALTLLLDNELIESFYEFTKKCKSVICCRVSPLQKASIVAMVRTRSTATTLAIGDGANDVGMILEADIGVGVAGKEGRQAVNSSDYSIGQFRFLKRLLLIHGRLNFYRNVELVNYSFYKNMCFTSVQLLYGFFMHFSGNTLYDSTLYTIFNVIFTSAPPVIYAGLERDVSMDSMMEIPELFNMDGKREYFQSMKRFWLSLLLGLFHAVICFFVPYFSLQPFTTNNGFSIGLGEYGVVVYFCVVAAVNARIASMCSYWTGLHFFFILGSVMIFPLTVLCVDYMGISPTLIGVTLSTFGSRIAWFSVLATILIAFVPILIIKVINNNMNTITNRVLYYERSDEKIKTLREEVAEFIPPEEPPSPHDKEYPDTNNETGYIFDEPASINTARFETRVRKLPKDYAFKTIEPQKPQKVSSFVFDGL